MNDNDDIEKEISRVISGKIHEPKEYKIAIEKALYANDKKIKSTYVYKMIAAICCSLILLSGIVYAGYSIIQNVFNNRKGVDTAISNNYIMDGLESYQESNGIAIKINNMLIDDYNLDISFNVKFDEKIDTENINMMQFEKMIIIDEENNILFHRGGKQVLDNFISNNELNININKFNTDNINSSETTKVKNNKNKQLDLIYNISTYENEYARSKSIIIYIENIIINENKIINGKWQIKQNIDPKFYNREKIVYKYEDDGGNNIINVNVTTYPTGTNISIELKTNEKINDKTNLYKTLDEIKNEIDNMNVELNNKYIDNLRNKLLLETDKLYNMFSDIYIKNSNGIKFYTTESVNENDKILKSDENEIIQYFDIVDMTLYDCTSKVTLHFIYNDKEYNIELKI